MFQRKGYSLLGPLQSVSYSLWTSFFFAIIRIIFEISWKNDVYKLYGTDYTIQMSIFYSLLLIICHHASFIELSDRITAIFL